jgi:LCP family protein required for cell wall assembly
MAQVIKEKFDITIHDFIHINTEVFAEVVDLFGGVDIYVPYDMHYEDPEQDLYIHLDEGEHHLDGKMAEGFVRFRTGVDDEGNVIEYGDIERKKNQIAFLKAFFEQHGTLGNLDKIPSFLDTLGKRVKSSIKATDVLFRYIGLARDIVKDKYPIEDHTLVGTYKMIDGVSYIVFE